MKANPVNRRSAVRIVPPKTLQASLEGSKKKLVVYDISLGGVAVVSDTPFPLNSTHVVNLTHRGIVVSGSVRTAHCRKCPTGWLVGFAFTPVPRGRGPGIEDLIDDLTGAMITFPLT